MLNNSFLLFKISIFSPKRYKVFPLSQMLGAKTIPVLINIREKYWFRKYKEVELKDNLF